MCRCNDAMISDTMCIPYGWSASGSVMRDHSDHSRTSKEPTNPLWQRIHRFIWCRKFLVISDHWSWSGSSQRNAQGFVNWGLPFRLVWLVTFILQGNDSVSERGDLGDWMFRGVRVKTLLYWLTWFFKQGWRYWLKRMITKLQGVLIWPRLLHVDGGLVEKKNDEF